MTVAERARTAWGCESCRRYRRTALVLGVLATVVWLLR